MFKPKTSIAAALLVLGSLCAGAAHAGNVQWSVGINLPPVGTVISSGPVYQVAQPYYYEPAPVYVRPAPVVVYRPEPVVVYRPAPVYEPSYYYEQPVVRSTYVVPGYGWHHGHHEWREERHEHRDWHEGRHDDHHDEYGDRHGEDRWTPGPRRQHH